jgi:hypothetical protein
MLGGVVRSKQGSEILAGPEGLGVFLTFPHSFPTKIGMYLQSLRPWNGSGLRLGLRCNRGRRVPINDVTTYTWLAYLYTNLSCWIVHNLVYLWL